VTAAIEIRVRNSNTGMPRVPSRIVEEIARRRYGRSALSSGMWSGTHQRWRRREGRRMSQEIIMRIMQGERPVRTHGADDATRRRPAPRSRAATGILEAEPLLRAIARIERRRAAQGLVASLRAVGDQVDGTDAVLGQVVRVADETTERRHADEGGQ